MEMIKAGIIGGAGYTGGELIRLLLHHPSVTLKCVNSRSHRGHRVDSVHQDLVGETDLIFTEEPDLSCDVLFFCTGHNQTRSLIEEMKLPAHIKLIDLSADFRLNGNALAGRNFVYGLPELNKSRIENADSIANPGCFATAIQLALLPLIANGHAENCYVTGITGSTGAGQSLTQSSHFSWRNNNIQPYKTLVHQHVGEIKKTIESFNQAQPDVLFTPWRGDFSRGIFITLQTPSKLSLEEWKTKYNSFYKEACYTHCSDHQIHLKQVVNTNKCLIHLEKVGEQLVVHSAIDNLLKGASGQAVQNMNLMFGLAESSGLNLKAVAF